MARDFIKIDRTTISATQAIKLANYVATLRQAIEQGAEVKAIMDHNQDGSNFSDIETLFGLATGAGSTVYDLVNGSVGSFSGTFQTADAKNITERVG